MRRAGFVGDAGRRNLAPTEVATEVLTADTITAGTVTADEMEAAVVRSGQIRIPRPSPGNNAEIEAAINVTTAAFYRLDRLNAGSPVSIGDQVATLTAAGTPTRQRIVSGRAGTYFPADGDRFGADVLPVGTSSFGGVGRFASVADPSGANSGLFGRTTAAAKSWCFYRNKVAGDLKVYFDDNAGHVFDEVVLAAALPVGGEPLDIAFKFNRVPGTPVLNVRCSRNGVLLAAVAIPMATLATLDVAAQTMAIGDVLGLSTGEGIWCEHLGMAIGAQVEVADWEIDASIGMGYES